MLNSVVLIFFFKVHRKYQQYCYHNTITGNINIISEKLKNNRYSGLKSSLLESLAPKSVFILIVKFDV